MAVLEALLALVGFAVAVVFCAGILVGWIEAGEPPAPTAAEAYRDALRAAAHVTRAAFEAERAMYAEAERHGHIDGTALPPHGGRR
jgi:hypothetical protein